LTKAGCGAGALQTGHGSHWHGWSEHGSVVSTAQQAMVSNARSHAATHPNAESGVVTLSQRANNQTAQRGGRPCIVELYHNFLRASRETAVHARKNTEFRSELP